MKRSICMSFALSLAILGFSTLWAPQAVLAQAKGWCEEKTLVRATTLSDRVSMPAVAAQDDAVYIAYRQHNIKVKISRDRGKTWDNPIDLGPTMRVCGDPAITISDGNLIVIWPARVTVGETSPYQLFLCESIDQGKTWSKPKKLTQNRDDALQPRVLTIQGKILLLWLETPLQETLGQISGGKGIDLSVASPDELFRLSTGGRNVLENQQKRMRSTIYVSSIDSKTSTMTAPVRLDEIFSEWLPYIFTIYGPYNGGLYVTVNRNLDIRTYESKDGGLNWGPFFQDREYFDPRTVMDLKIIDNQRVASWIARAPFTAIPVNFRIGDDIRSTQLSAPHNVRALPRYAFSDNVYHVVWEAGQENDSWLTYIRTDDVSPTSTIVAPTSPELTGIEGTFAWKGDDNISSPDRLRYSYSYDDSQTWSTFDSATSATIKTPKDGEYVFRVRAEDVAGNIQKELAEFAFNTFKSAPDTEITQTPPASEELNTREVEISFTGTDNNDQPSQLHYSVKVDDASWTDFFSDQSYRFTNLSNGSHTFAVRARDTRNNIDSTPATCEVSIKVGLDLVLDVTPEANTNAESVSFAWTGKDDKGQPVALTYFYQLDKDPAKKLDTNKVDLAGLAEGRHTFVVWGEDGSGDQTPKVSYRWSIDRTPPDTTASFQKRFVGSNFPVLALAGKDPELEDGTPSSTPTKFEYSVEEGVWVPFTCNAPTWNFEKSASLISLGYVVKIRAIDFAGNTDQSPAVVDLRIWVTHPIYFYSVTAVLAIVLLFLLKMLLGKLRTPKRSKSSLEASTAATMSGFEEEKSSFDFGSSMDDDDGF
ncbi:MAG: hypothetical protein RBU29_06360 [bacterium]|nr:hypothetical protein [bacterium]